MGRKKKFRAVLSDRVVDEIGKLQREEQVEIYEAIERLCEDPYSGTPVIPEELDKIMVCKNCGSSDTTSYMDVGCGPHEIVFGCNNCGESFWMTEEDYRESLKNRPDLFMDK